MVPFDIHKTRTSHCTYYFKTWFEMISFCHSYYGGQWDGDDQRRVPRVDQDGVKGRALHWNGRKMQTVAISFGQEEETLCSSPTALQASVYIVSSPYFGFWVFKKAFGPWSTFWFLVSAVLHNCLCAVRARSTSRKGSYQACKKTVISVKKTNGPQ